MGADGEGVKGIVERDPSPPSGFPLNPTCEGIAPGGLDAVVIVGGFVVWLVGCVGATGSLLLNGSAWPELAR